MPTAKSLQIRAQSAALWHRAYALDMQAEECLQVQHPDAYARIKAARHARASTRGPERQRLRAFAKTHCHDALVRYTQADNLYWEIVGKYRGFIIQRAAQHARRSSAPIEEIESVMLLGAFEAAITWAPDEGAYTTYSAFYLRARWQRSNSRQNAVDLGQSRIIRAQGGFGKADVVSLDALLPDQSPGDRRALLDVLAVEAGFGGDVERALTVAYVQQLVEQLAPRAQQVVVDYCNDVRTDDTAKAMGVSRAWVNILLRTAVQELRRSLHARPTEHSAAVPTPPPKRGRPKKVLPVPHEEALRLVDQHGLRLAAVQLGLSHETLRKLLAVEVTPASDVPRT